MLIYKPLQLKFKTRLEAKRYFGHTRFNELMKDKNNFEFINNTANYYDNLRNNSKSEGEPDS